VAELQPERARHWSDEFERLYRDDPLLGPGLGPWVQMQQRQAPVTDLSECMAGFARDSRHWAQQHATAQQQYALMQAQTMEAPSVGKCIGNAFGMIFGGLR